MESPPEGLSGEDPRVHELIFGNGTKMWALEDAADFENATLSER